MADHQLSLWYRNQHSTLLTQESGRRRAHAPIVASGAPSLSLMAGGQARSQELTDGGAGDGDPALGRGRGQVVIAGRAGLAPAGRTGGQRGDNGIEGVV